MYKLGKRLPGIVGVLCLVVALLLSRGLLDLVSPQGVSASPGVIYVKWDAPGPTFDGNSWATAYTSLQTALSAAIVGDEIWVAAGTYVPGANRANTFTLKTGVALYGGFGGSETLRLQRDYSANVTTLSGDIGTPGTATDNSYYVIIGSGTNSTAVLDGFVITAGHATGSGDERDGAGMFNDGGSPTVRNCRFVDNFAIRYGGAMANTNASNPAITNCAFQNNMTNDPPSSNTRAGAIHNSASSPQIINCTFSGNSATQGAALTNANNSNPVVTNCVLWGASTTPLVQ